MLWSAKLKEFPRESLKKSTKEEGVLLKLCIPLSKDSLAPFLKGGTTKRQKSICTRGKNQTYHENGCAC